jgi:hypothetical protein
MYAKYWPCVLVNAADRFPVVFPGRRTLLLDLPIVPATILVPGSWQMANLGG